MFWLDELLLVQLHYRAQSTGSHQKFHPASYFHDHSFFLCFLCSYIPLLFPYRSLSNQLTNRGPFRNEPILDRHKLSLQIIMSNLLFHPQHAKLEEISIICPTSNSPIKQKYFESILCLEQGIQCTLSLVPDAGCVTEDEEAEPQDGNGASLQVEDVELPPENDSDTAAVSFTVVGATGHLATQEIFPALFALFYKGCLPKVGLSFWMQGSMLSEIATLAGVAFSVSCTGDTGHRQSNLVN